MAPVKKSQSASNPLGFSSTKKTLSKSKSTKKTSPSPALSVEPTRPAVKKSRSGEYAALLRASKKAMGKPMVQKESLGWSDEELILHIFDNSDEFGPTACGTRMDRFKRARTLGLNPPPEIESILLNAGPQLQRPFTSPPDIKGK